MAFNRMIAHPGFLQHDKNVLCLGNSSESEQGPRMPLVFGVDQIERAVAT
jgi:hypothetical protein